MRTRIRRGFFIAKNDVVFLFLGRLKQDKGILALGKAFARLLQTQTHIHLLIVGPDEESLQTHSLFNQIQNVNFVGHTQTPEQYMNAADIFCLPSHREGFGSVILEAACVGIPAVASRIYGITDAVVEGKTGLLHRPGDVDDLCHCMKIFLENPGLRLTMGAAARHRAVTDFSEDSVSDALLHFYRQAGAGPRKNGCSKAPSGNLVL
ncbi:MAG TPA: glycosyltransferase [Desulfotignum sp.]|nr:glycosyltransferase [Desulfotignum sp.]